MSISILDWERSFHKPSKNFGRKKQLKRPRILKLEVNHNPSKNTIDNFFNGKSNQDIEEELGISKEELKKVVEMWKRKNM